MGESTLGAETPALDAFSRGSTATSSEFVLVNRRTGRPLAERLEVVRATWQQLLALLGQGWLRTGHGRRFLAGAGDGTQALPVGRLTVDVLVLDRSGRVLQAVHSLPPFQVRDGHVHSVVELPPGTLARLDAQTGDVVEVYRARDAQPERRSA